MELVPGRPKPVALGYLKVDVASAADYLEGLSRGSRVSVSAPVLEEKRVDPRWIESEVLCASVS